jgi:starch synthase (maltosyl-transferring)
METARRPARLAESEPGRDRRRIAIEGVSPAVDDGRFPVKRVEGDLVVVEADVLADGHDRLAAVVWHRRSGPAAGDWVEQPMRPIGNDRWRAEVRAGEPGRYEFTIEAWVDRLASWRHALEKKHAAGQDVEAELIEGALMVRAVAASVAASADRSALEASADLLESGESLPVRVAAALEDRLYAAWRRHDPRAGRTRLGAAQPITVDRARARFGAWYEMFPRSAGPDPSRSATFDEAAARLPAIAEMGFDILYLPPIHPIGRTFRKGRNNALEAAPGAPGSPWAIGGPEGGHMAVERGLGTLADFDRFVRRATDAGLEVALDLAYQCSPDHPWVREHPEWFRHRPDGSIKYAENPPKRYQDIYPIDFETDAWRALWEELRRVVLFWVDRGVRAFRVDNPHTKPFRFWEWLIRTVQETHPDVLFLAEAFTRPKVMRQLAKRGFTQSYTYFTWRNRKAELEEYLTELTQTPVREYMRPNFFANTPDILHAYLQEGGRAAFQVRAVLAATLAATYGIYSGFELCENRAVPGTEEYLDSEKYQIRQWDWDRPGHIRPLLTRLNLIRRACPALQHDWTLGFHETDNDQLICYSKTAGASAVLVVVNLDPHHLQHGWIRVPLERLGLAAGAAFEVVDRLTGERYGWTGDSAYVRLDPAERVAHVLEVA